MSNIFETKTGVTSVAPIKISGKYKVVVDIKGNLYLDDFLGRRVALDINNNFLPQVANFLSTSTIEPESKYLQYGCNHENKQKSYLIPLYLGNVNDLPKYFVIHDTHKNIIDFKNLTDIGLTKIFTEICDMFQYPITTDFDENKLNIIGYSIKDLTKKPFSINIIESLANQNKIENFNNTILNTFVRNEMFYPRFINIEFEFDYEKTTNNFDYETFTGFLSNGEYIFNPNYFNPEELNVLVGLGWKQVLLYDKYIYEDFVDTTTITNIANTIAEIRFVVKTMSEGDRIKIYVDNKIDFEYVVSKQDIRSNLYETVTRFCNSATKQSYNNYVFSISQYTRNEIEIKITNSDDSEDCMLEIPKKFNYINDQKWFRHITDRDFKLFNTSELNINVIRIRNRIYDVAETFIIDDNTYVRLTKDVEINQGESEIIYLYQYKNSQIFQLKPITYLSFDDDLKVNYQYNPDLYIEELRERFIYNRIDGNNLNIDNMMNASIAAIESFKANLTSYDKYPYTKDIETDEGKIETIESENVVQKSPTTDKVLKLMFSSVGHSSYVSPNILNYDKRFWESSACLNPIKLDNDYMKFNWFLIKGVTPKYLKDTNEGLRYFTDKPKLTSRIINFTGTDYCETLFLGVKYIIPVRYKDYDFAVYLDIDTDKELDYVFDINHKDKKLYLVIYKFMDFIDLIKGGNSKNEALIDLTLLYNVQDSYNTLSDALYSFRTGGILFCDESLPVMFDYKMITDWKVKETSTNKWYICLKRSRNVITDSFTNIFPNNGNSEFYVYSTIVDETGQRHSYISVKFTVVNIRALHDDYLWCENVIAEFYDTNKMFLIDNDEKVYGINEAKILQNTPLSGNIFSDYESNVVTTLVTASGNSTFKVINFDKVLSFKEYYFEIVRNVEYKPNGEKVITDTSFTFPECVYPIPNVTQELSYLVDNFERGDTLDQTSYKVKLNLFHRNQIWNLLRELINVDIRFKHTLVSQTRRIINNLLVSNLIERSELSTIPSNIPGENIKLIINNLDSNVVIWKDYTYSKGAPKINQIYRHRGIYIPYLVDTNKFTDKPILNYSSDFTVETNWVKELNYMELLADNITGIDSNLLLTKYYRIKYITNELNQKLKYFINADNEFTITFNDLTSYNERFRKLYLTFERK